MRALVTGASGFVGGYLVSHLLEQGDHVVGLSRLGSWCGLHSSLAPKARLERLDLADVEEDQLIDLLERKQPEVIYHLAAQANPAHSLIDPRGTWAVNLGGTLNLLEAVRILAIKRPELPRPRVIIVSSGVCYGIPKPELVPVNECCPLAPNSPYAASKAAADLLAVQHWLAYGTATIIARPFNHAGPGQSESYVLSSLCRQVAEVEAGRRAMVEHGDLSVVRDFTDVRDVVRAYRLLAVHGQAGEVYNIGTGRDIALSRLLELILDFASVPVRASNDPARRRTVDQPRLVADSSKIRTETGWAPMVPIDETLRDMLDYWRSRSR